MSTSKITTAQQHQLAVIGAAILDPAACKATVERLRPQRGCCDTGADAGR